MGFLDVLTSSSFRKANNGKWIFYPWGPIGKGYIVYSNEIYTRLRSKINIWMLVVFFLIISGSFVLNLFGKVLILILFLVIYVLWVKRQTQGLIPFTGYERENKSRK